MRAVTFSDARVADYMQRHFVASWKNIRPEVKFKRGQYDDRRSKRSLARLRSGAGETNICAFVATAEGKILHVVQGYAKPEEFLRELRFARNTSLLMRGDADMQDLPSIYRGRLGEVKGSSASFMLLTRRNLSRLADSPLPSLDSLKDATRAGLPRK